MINSACIRLSMLPFKGLAAGLAAMTLCIIRISGAAAADTDLKIFDTHVHYSRDAWGVYPPYKILKKLEAAGVYRALVSSTPDDGTLKLHGQDKKRFIPALRPYRGAIGSGNWVQDSGLIGYLEGRLKNGIYKGIGEFHLFEVAPSDLKPLKAVTALALKYGVHLFVHSGAAPVEALFKMSPQVKVHWAHAGMNEPPTVVGDLLDKYQNLTVELSFRDGDIPGVTGIDPAWLAVFQRHPDRFMIGSDTYVTPRWDDYPGLIDSHRSWLKHLPRPLAEAIAFKNAERVFGN